MARSMTGFGRGQVVLADRKCNIEIKSINSKYCDLQIRLPRTLNGLENRIRESVTKALNRGKIDVFIYFEDNREDSKTVTVDLPLVKAYQHALQEISALIGYNGEISASQIAKMNDVLQVQSVQLDEEETWLLVSEALDAALDALCVMRGSEGGALVRDIMDKCGVMEWTRQQVLARAPFVSQEYRTRLRQRIMDLAGDLVKELLDEQRLAMEVAIFADKCAIDEELVRLASHIAQLESTLQEDQAVGKKLDFILQEMNREINTIGSKANDITITKCVVEMKTELEKIREQIQNIE
jgi:uncharacterized protein (TIGR00255 family)